jgi:hypothetical protein
MSKNEYTIDYGVPLDDEAVKVKYRTACKVANYMATDAAQHYWDACEDKSTWPLVFELFQDDVSIGKFTITFKMLPTFYSKETKS